MPFRPLCNVHLGTYYKYSTYKCYRQVVLFSRAVGMYEKQGLQTMTEAAFFTIGRSRIIGFCKIQPLADYRGRS